MNFKALFLALLLLVSATPAHADAFRNREIAFQVLNGLDAAETLHCLNQGTCREGNPLLGQNPSTEAIIATKVVGGVLHYLIAKKINDRSPKWGKVFQIVTIGLQGSVVVSNLRFVF